MDKTKRVIARKGEWEIHEGEFRNRFEFAYIENLKGEDYIIVKIPTTLEQYQDTAQSLLSRHSIVLSNKERHELGNIKGWEYYVNDKTGLKFKVCPFTKEVKEVWTRIVATRLVKE